VTDTRKLPVILRPIYVGHRGGNILATHFHPDGVASFEQHFSDGHMEHLPLETVKYEPAVGRCETCAYFDEHQAMAQCNNLEGLVVPRATGYCSEHEPKG